MEVTKVTNATRVYKIGRWLGSFRSRSLIEIVLVSRSFAPKTMGSAATAFIERVNAALPISSVGIIVRKVFT